MSANFSAVIIDGNYTTLMQTITDLFKAVAQGLDPAVVTPLNTPANALRWELTTNKRLEKFNGTAWASAEPAGGFAMNISGSSSKWGTPRTITIGGDASGVSGAWDGSANLSFNITLATVPPNKGGTGIVSYTIGDIPYASGASTLSKLAGVAYGNVLLSGGVATASSWGKVGLTTHVSGVLGMSNGGHAGTTAAQARTNLGLVIGTDVMGMGGGTCTGPLAATNLSGTNTGDEAAASSTVAGVAELATQTEVNNGDATRIVTGATMAGRTATTTRAGVIATSTDSVAQASPTRPQAHPFRSITGLGRYRWPSRSCTDARRLKVVMRSATSIASRRTLALSRALVTARSLSGQTLRRLVYPTGLRSHLPEKTAHHHSPRPRRTGARFCAPN